jgi:hypothetical protein
MQQGTNALRNYANHLIKSIDKETGEAGKKTSLANSIKSLSKALGTRGSFSGDGNVADAVASLGSSGRPSGSPDNPVSSIGLPSKKSSSSGGSGGSPAFQSGGDDLDFFDTEEGNNEFALGDDKEALKLDEFEIDHDDINKKKEVSIFKILSNRYLLSYPVFLEKK